MMRECLGPATKNASATLGIGVALLALYVGFQALTHRLGDLEVARYPVLADVAICEGSLDKASGDCAGRVVLYPAFAQSEARCDGRDAIVSGTLSKVRRARYLPGRQVVYYGRPDGVSRRAWWRPMDQPDGAPKSRPPGVQDWGPWRLIGGCATRYETWFTTVEHEPWHGLYPLVTNSGPFALPRAEADSPDPRR
ncbi:hypothetical protein [Jiella marina]|uniref:hypothetical protein n=1 Tax=Jiella sp. LLJ827 TaxID=2917712 RepID=UPI0021018B0D|nr:hypothetical protein [Jiella sp. LLJ827]MCQ0986382.1 hypothetical protein [Jiella sp. LLJ827]